MDSFTSFFSNVTLYDVAILVIALFFFFRGLWVGAVRQLSVLLALYLGYITASQYHQEIFPMLARISSNPKVIFLTSYVLLFIATYLVVLLLGQLLKTVVKLSLVDWFDSLMGGVIGLLKTVIVVVLLHMLLGTVFDPGNATLRKCAVCPQLNTLSDITRNIIRDPAARKALLQQAPAIGADVVKEYLDSPASGKEKRK